MTAPLDVRSAARRCRGRGRLSSLADERSAAIDRAAAAATEKALEIEADRPLASASTS